MASRCSLYRLTHRCRSVCILHSVFRSRAFSTNWLSFSRLMDAFSSAPGLSPVRPASPSRSWCSSSQSCLIWPLWACCSRSASSSSLWRHASSCASASAWDRSAAACCERSSSSSSPRDAAWSRHWPAWRRASSVCRRTAASSACSEAFSAAVRSASWDAAWSRCCTSCSEPSSSWHLCASCPPSVLVFSLARWMFFSSSSSVSFVAAAASSSRAVCERLCRASACSRSTSAALLSVSWHLRRRSCSWWSEAASCSPRASSAAFASAHCRCACSSVPAISSIARRVVSRSSGGGFCFSAMLCTSCWMRSSFSRSASGSTSCRAKPTRSACTAFDQAVSAGAAGLACAAGEACTVTGICTDDPGAHTGSAAVVVAEQAGTPAALQPARVAPPPGGMRAEQAGEQLGLMGTSTPCTASTCCTGWGAHAGPSSTTPGR
mmetsp:Transcript_29144/g.76347  ORF Transcript_29144/g.76347 Transcript_29144/m.76347 type:complete len:435 (-) Transcript_29144:2-1306(-)